MAQHIPWWQHPVWSWLAKGWLIVCIPTVVLFAVAYTQRKAEADAYAQAPICAPAVTDSSSCRLMTDAEITNINCPSRSVTPRDSEVCWLKLQVGGMQHVVGFPLVLSETLTPGARLRVELFRGGPSGAQFGGKFVPQSGSPQEAAQMLMASLGLALASVLIAAVYLWKRKQWSKR